MSYTPLWELPDDLWQKIERLLPPDKPVGSVGRPALPNCQVVNGILFVLRSGCQWKGLKKEWYGASSSLHARFQDWCEAGVWKKIYRMMVKYYHKKRRIQWTWQAVDSKLVAAPLGDDQSGPTPPLETEKYPARRWVVERTLSWQNDFRSLRVRWAKKSSNWLALLYFASALILWRMCSLP